MGVTSFIEPPTESNLLPRIMGHIYLYFAQLRVYISALFNITLFTIFFAGLNSKRCYTRSPYVHCTPCLAQYSR